VSDGAAARSDPVDYVLEYRTQRSFLVSPTYPSVLIAESKILGAERPVTSKATSTTDTTDNDDHRPPSQQLVTPLDWHGKDLRVAVTRTEEKGSDLTVAFDIANDSPRTDDNVAGNNISGDENVTGSNNQTAPVALAPNGIAIAGGTVNNPTVNNVSALPDLTMSDEQEKQVTDSLGQIFSGADVSITIVQAKPDDEGFFRKAWPNPEIRWSQKCRVQHSLDVRT
jgi:hypothetical protein